MRKPVGKLNRVTFGYGASSYPYSASNRHAGTDYSFKPNPYAYAPEKVKITFVGTLGPCGRAINATGQSGRTYRYCHLEKYLVKKGQTVKEGTKVGRIGATGYAFGKHLHLVMWVKGKRVNPDVTIKNIIKKEKNKMYKNKGPKYWYTKLQSKKKELAKAVKKVNAANKAVNTLKAGQKVTKEQLASVKAELANAKTALTEKDDTNEKVNLLFGYFYDKWQTVRNWVDKKKGK